MPRGRNAKKNGPSFYETCRQAGESEEELEQGPSKPSASAGRSSARGSKRGQAADEAIDVDDLPERDANKAHKHHEGAGAAGNVASDGDEDRGSMIGARAAPSEFGARAGRPTRSRTASNQASPLAPELPDRKRVQSRLPSPLQGAAAARRRTPTLRSVEAQQQSAEAAAARESRARRRNGTSPPKALYDLESEMEGNKEGSACSEVEYMDAEDGEDLEAAAREDEEREAAVDGASACGSQGGGGGDDDDDNDSREEPDAPLPQHTGRNTLISGLQSLPPFRRPECFRHKREHANYVLNGEQCAVCRPPELLRLSGLEENHVVLSVECERVRDQECGRQRCAVCRPPELLRLLGVLRSRSGVGREPFCLMSVLEVER